MARHDEQAALAVTALANRAGLRAALEHSLAAGSARRSLAVSRR